MKPGNILNLTSTKVYYPFFKGKDERIKDLNTEASFLLSYLIVTDIVVIPPREFLNSSNIKTNMEGIQKNKLLFSNFMNGSIVTSSTNSSI